MEPRPRRTCGALAVAGALWPAACGGGPDHVNRERPPATITVTAAILGERVKVSPRRFGAGSIRLLVSNQTGTPQRLTLTTAGRAAGITRSTGPIAASGTATLELDVPRGEYDLRTGAEATAARVSVGAPRSSAQDALLQP